MPQRILPYPELATFAKEWQGTGQRVVVTNGVFDLMHIGHLRYLQAARELGDILLVGVNSDASTRRLKGSQRPIVPAEERAEMLAGLACVDYVTIFPEDTAEALVATVRPAVYVKGGDYQIDPTVPTGKILPEAAIVQAYGGEVQLIPYLDGHSTSALITRVRQLD